MPKRQNENVDLSDLDLGSKKGKAEAFRRSYNGQGHKGTKGFKKAQDEALENNTGPGLKNRAYGKIRRPH